MTFLKTAMRVALVSSFLLPFACGGDDSTTTNTPDGGGATDAMADGSSPGDTSVPIDSSPTSEGGTACTGLIGPAIARGCTRCWPAYQVLCTKGNAAAVDGMFACLVGNMMCWDVGDPNTAIPCMQGVVTANTTPQLTAVATKLMSVGCSGNSLVSAESWVAMMSPADQTAYGTCIASATSCTDPLLQSCFSSTSFDVTLCKN